MKVLPEVLEQAHKSTIFRSYVAILENKDEPNEKGREAGVAERCGFRIFHCGIDPGKSSHQNGIYGDWIKTSVIYSYLHKQQQIILIIAAIEQRRNQNWI